MSDTPFNMTVEGIKGRLAAAHETSYLGYDPNNASNVWIGDAEEDIQWLIEQVISLRRLTATATFLYQKSQTQVAELMKLVNQPPGPFQEIDKMRRG